MLCRMSVFSSCLPALIHGSRPPHVCLKALLDVELKVHMQQLKSLVTQRYKHSHLQQAL